MKANKTKVLCKIKTEWNELMNLKCKYFVILAPFTYRPVLTEIANLRNKISSDVVHLPRVVFFFNKR
jgi:hypothetical protein